MRYNRGMMEVLESIKKYDITEKNLLAHELVGLECEVIESSDKTRKGIKGVIQRETMNTLVVSSKGSKKTLPKKEVTLEIKIGEKKVKVKGEDLVGRTEERTKKACKRMQ